MVMTKNCLLLVFVLKCSILLLNAQKVNETNFGSIGNPKQQPSKAIDAYSLTYTDFSEDSQGSLPRKYRSFIATPFIAFKILWVNGNQRLKC